MSLENLKEYASRCATDPDLLVAAKSIGIADIEEHIRHAGAWAWTGPGTIWWPSGKRLPTTGLKTSRISPKTNWNKSQAVAFLPR